MRASITNVICTATCNCQYNCNADPPLPPRGRKMKMQAFYFQVQVKVFIFILISFGPLYDTGCPVLAPPMQGALVCLRTVDTMYCSVYCDNLFEFASTPLNPYYCGACSNFRWTDYVTKQTYTELPRCTGKEMLVARLAV